MTWEGPLLYMSCGYIDDLRIVHELDTAETKTNAAPSDLVFFYF
jgi:hypothetical protein